MQTIATKEVSIAYHADALKSKVIRLPEVLRAVGLARSTIYKLIGAGRFPRQIKLAGGKCSAWRQVEIEKWLNEQTAPV